MAEHRRSHPWRRATVAARTRHWPRSMLLGALLLLPVAGATADSATVDFGTSVRGTPLRASLFGSGGDTTLILSGVHGDEPSGPGVVERLRRYLSAHPAACRGSRVVLVPRMNPDGLRARRRTNAHGVDLNRNLPYGWRQRSRGRYYGGPQSASEPETRALIRLIARYRPSKVVSIHQPKHCLDWTGARGWRLAALMSRHNGYRGIRGDAHVLPGCLGGYCGKGLGIAMVTLELPWASADAAWRQNEGALLAAIRARP